jgi:hypothetical protein
MFLQLSLLPSIMRFSPLDDYGFCAKHVALTQMSCVFVHLIAKCFSMSFPGRNQLFTDEIDCSAIQPEKSTIARRPATQSDQ